MKLKQKREKKNNIKSGFSEKINKMDKPLARLIKEKKNDSRHKSSKSGTEGISLYILQTLKGKYTSIMTFMSINLITEMKWTNSFERKTLPKLSLRKYVSSE